MPPFKMLKQSQAPLAMEIARNKPPYDLMEDRIHVATNELNPLTITEQVKYVVIFIFPPSDQSNIH
jgi:hypothetical protein